MESIRRIKKLSKVLRIFSIVCIAMLLVAFAAILTLSIFSATGVLEKLTGDGVFSFDAASLIGTSSGLHFDDVSAAAGEPGGINVMILGAQYRLSGGEFSLLLVCVLVSLAFYLLILCFVHRLAKQLEKSESPFDKRVVSSLSLVGYSLLAWCVAPGLINGGIISYITSGSVSLLLQFDFSLVMIVLVTVLIISIFKYGAVLQNESDTTL